MVAVPLLPKRKRILSWWTYRKIIPKGTDLARSFDVEYIPLETTDEFVTLGWLQAIGKDVMIVRNMFAADGNIFIYDRKGKAVRKD